MHSNVIYTISYCRSGIHQEETTDTHMPVVENAEMQESPIHVEFTALQPNVTCKKGQDYFTCYLPRTSLVAMLQDALIKSVELN